MALRTVKRELFSLKAATAAMAFGAATLLAAPQTAQAGIAPDTFMSVEIRDTSQVTLFDSGEVNIQSIGSGNMINGWTYFNPQAGFPALQDAMYTSSGLVQSRTQPGLLPAQLFSNMTYVNNTADTLEFIINLRMPMTTPTTGPVNWLADTAWNLGGPNNPTVLSLSGMSLFTASINGSQVASQLDDPSGFGGGGGQLQIDPLPETGMFGGTVNELSIQLAFSLTPGSNLGIQAIINVTPIPSPAAASLLALGGFFAARRRRRN